MFHCSDVLLLPCTTAFCLSTGCIKSCEAIFFINSLFPPPPSLSPSFSPFSSQRPHHAHALFDFTPHHPSQLRFLRGDVIELLDCSDSVRWRGRCHGHVGYFPPEYVQPIYQCQ